VAAEYEVNIKINSDEIERELGNIDKAVAKIGKPKGGGRRSKVKITGLPSPEELKVSQKQIAQLDAKVKNIQTTQDKFRERRLRAEARSNALNEKDLKLNRRLTAEAGARLRLLSEAGAKSFDRTRPQGRQLADDINARAKAQDKRAKLANKINEMEAKGLNVAKLRKRLGKATTEQAKGRFAGAQKEFRLLQKTIELEQSKLRILKEQRKGFPSSPIQGTATMAGSPKQIAEANKQAARNQRRAERNDRRAEADRRRAARIRGQEQRALQGRLRAGVGPESVFGPLRQLGRASMIAGADEAKLLAGRFRAPSSPLTARPVTRASADQAAKQVEKEVMRRTALEKRATDQAAAYRRRVNKQVFRAKLDLDRIEYKQKIDDIVSYTNREIQEGNRAGRKFDEELDRRVKKREAATKRAMKRFGDVALGAGFPLLFGGGPGSVIGGGLGGLTGSFGAQIGLSAAGQQIDQLIGRTITSAESLTSVGKALDFLRERSLFSSKESEQLARKLENQGDLTGVAALVTEELNKALGPDGIQKMQDLAEQTKLAKEQWGQLTTNLELLISGPLTEFLAIVNATLGIKVAQSNFARSLGRLQERDPERLRGLLPSFEGAKDPAKAVASNLAFGPNMAAGVFNMQGLSEGALISFTEQINSILAEETGLEKGTLPITEEDKKRFRPKGATKKDKLPELEAERDKLEKLLNLEEKRFGLQSKEDDAAVLRLQAREKVAEIAEEVARIKASDLTAEQKAVALQIQSIENARVNLELSFKLSELERKRQEKFEDTIEDLDHQLALARATTEEERERLRIEEALRKLREDDKLSQPQLDAIRTRMEALAEEKNLINTFLKETREQIEKLNDPMFQAISLAQTLGNAFSESFRGIVDGSMSAQQALANLFQRTADHFLDMAAQMIAAQLRMQAVKLFMSFFPSSGVPSGFSPSSPDIGGTFGVTPKTAGIDFSDAFKPKALGGAVGAGRPYMVGERGPELFVPGAQGNIVPNNAMGGSNIVVNVDASGSSVEGDSNQAAQLGKMLGAAVQAELVKQKRPGGLLAS